MVYVSTTYRIVPSHFIKNLNFNAANIAKLSYNKTLKFSKKVLINFISATIDHKNRKSTNNVSSILKNH